MSATYSTSEIMRRYLDLLQERAELDETPEDVRQAIQQRVDAIPDEEDLVDVLKYTRKFSLKKDVQTFATLRAYKDTVSSVFLKALADSDLPDDEIKKFLDKLSKDGILDAGKLLAPAQIHSTKDIIDSSYENVFNAIKLPVFRDISGKIGEMGDVGKGEYLLDILSPAVNRRGAPGDLDVEGTKVELKAGENGRIGPAGSQSLAGRFPREFAPLLQKLMPGKPIPDPTVFNPKLNMSGFSEFFDNDPKKVKTALNRLLQMHYPEGIPTQSIANRVVGSSGEIDGQQLKKEMLGASFQVYKDAKGFDGIIIMDKDINRFLYVDSPETLKSVANSLLVSFPSWTDTQSNAMKVTLAKGRGKSAQDEGPGAGTGGAAPAAPALDTAQLDVISDRPRLTGPGAKAASRAAAPKSDVATLGRKKR